MRLSELGLKQRSKKKAIAWPMGRQAFVSSSRPFLESCLQLLHIWEGRFGAYNRRICGFTLKFKVSSGQDLLESRMSEQWVAARIKQKGDSKCVPWRSLKDAILTHPDVRKRLDVFALSIYGLVVFPKALGHVDEAVTNLFDRLDKKVTLILKIQEMPSAWKQIRRMKGLAVGPMTTLEYNEWWGRRINDNIPKVNQEGRQPIEEHL
ncbi:hypothetical protein GOBAR_DD08799 [Gossypium barbadense]|nr:hypothetical protein GOBAR_DD08799 [Gossypium barbadense]